MVVDEDAGIVVNRHEPRERGGLLGAAAVDHVNLYPQPPRTPRDRERPMPYRQRVTDLEDEYRRAGVDVRGQPHDSGRMRISPSSATRKTARRSSTCERMN